MSVAALVASASVVPASGSFGTLKRQAVEINALWVICPKHAHRVYVSQDFVRHQEAATKAKALPYRFALAKHFHAKNADGEFLTSMPTSSPNTQGVLQRSRPSRSIWTLRTWLENTYPPCFLIICYLLVDVKKAMILS